MKLNTLLNIWLYEYHKDNIRPQTFLRYECTINNYIITEHISKKRINRITPYDIQEFINLKKKQISRKTKTYLSANNINIIITVLKLAFTYAVDFGLLKDNPCTNIRRLSAKTQKKMTAYTVKEQLKIERYIDSLNDPEYFGIILCLYTGLRIGELMALEWEDIDFKKGILTIDKTIYTTKDEEGDWCYEINSPKTASSNREIPLPAYIVTKLKQLKSVSLSKRVVSKNNGKFMSAKLYRWRFQELTKKIKIRTLNFHSLRHTFATRAIESGMDVKTLSEIMGHANASITLNIYTHTMSKHKRDMMNNIPILVEVY